MNEQSDLPTDLADVAVERLKHGTGRYSHVILVPQPTDDPNDMSAILYIRETLLPELPPCVYILLNSILRTCGSDSFCCGFRLNYDQISCTTSNSGPR